MIEEQKVSPGGQQIETSVSSPRKKEFNLQDLIKVTELLCKYHSTNLPLLQYLLELLTIKLEKEVNPTTQTSLTYLQLLTYTCQSLMQEYQNNKDKYTARSIKHIQYTMNYAANINIFIMKNILDKFKEFKDLIMNKSNKLLSCMPSFPLKGELLGKKQEKQSDKRYTNDSWIQQQHKHQQN